MGLADMARIRSVHPGLFTDEAFVSVSMPARMLAIGIWTECDDQGAFEWKPVTFKMRLMPADTVDVSALLEEIRIADMVKPYEVGGKRYGLVRNFCKYQRPKKPNSVHPIPVDLKPYAGHHPDTNVPPSPPSGGVLSPTSGEPVGNGFPTGGKKSPQVEDGGCIGREEDQHATHADVLPLFHDDDTPAGDLRGNPQSPTPAARLFSEGLPILARLIGKPAPAARAMLGKLRRLAGDDCEAVLGVIREAAVAEPVEPMGWLIATIQTRTTGVEETTPDDSGGDRCGIAAWIATLPDVKDDPDPQAPELRRWAVSGVYVDWVAEQVADAARLHAAWRGDWGALARWLREDLDPDASVLPTIRRIADRNGYTSPRSMAFFDAAVREAAGRRVA